MEEVECAECNNRYDSQVHAFCPRCGNVSQREGPVSFRPQAFDPRRRRAQAGGVILISTAGLSLLLYIYAMVVAPTLLTPDAAALMQGQPGGTLQVQLEGLDGATINVTTFDGESIDHGNASNGTVTFQDLASAAVNVTVHHGNGTWLRQALVLEGQTVVVRIAADDPMDGAGLAGADSLLTPIRVVLGFFAAVAAFVILAGVSALRLRHHAVAISGGIVGLLPVLILAVAFPTVGSLLFLLLMATALVFIAMGRKHFT